MVSLREQGRTSGDGYSRARRSVLEHVDGGSSAGGENVVGEAALQLRRPIAFASQISSHTQTRKKPPRKRRERGVAQERTVAQKQHKVWGRISEPAPAK